MKRTYSGKKGLRSLFILILVFTLAALGLLGGYAFYTVQQELDYCNEATVELYMTNLDQLMASLESFDRNVCANNPYFARLSLESGGMRVDDRLNAEFNLRTLIGDQVGQSAAVYVFNRRGTVNLYRIGAGFFHGSVTPELVDAMHQVQNVLLNHEDNLSGSNWTLLEVDGRSLLFHYAAFQDRFCCSFIDMQAFADDYFYAGKSENARFSFFTRDRILTNEDYLRSENIALSDVWDAVEGNSRQYFVQRMVFARYNPTNGVGVCAVLGMTGVRSYVNRFLGILAVVGVCIVLFFGFVYTFTSRMLVFPLEQIAEAGRRVAEGESLPETEERLLEFQNIRRALSGLVEQKVTLERENIQRAYQKDHALLQYYQLQTRSHFFLNSLKSIYNLVSRNEMEKCKRVITLFSSHIRYVFHDSLTFVPLRSELAEVTDYYQIIQLERSTPLLVTDDVPEELLDFPVPPLCVQTFLENFNKCNAQGEKLLRFSIRADRVELEDAAYVRIRLSDNGVGFSEEALRMLQEPDDVFEQYHVGIRNLRRRMELLYHGKQQIAFFNNPTGGACSVLYLPVAQEEQA